MRYFMLLKVHQRSQKKKIFEGSLLPQSGLFL